MLKFNSVLLLVILCGGFHLSHGEKLVCHFGSVSYHVVGYLYQCKVTSLDNSFNNLTIDGYTGTHLANRNGKDVKAILIQGTKTKYIPHGLGSLFNLTAFLVDFSKLLEIKAENFLGMQDLEYLWLSYNQLTSVPSDTFLTLTKLKVIFLNDNQIKYIGPGTFDQLINLNKVYLVGNICVNKNYDGATAITQMKEDLKVNCVEPLSTSTTTTTTTTTTQNPMEVELKALKNELTAASEELQKEKSENLKVKNERDALVIKHDALKKELTEAKATCKINERSSV